MTYETLRRKARDLMLDADDVRDLIEAYADALEAAEPYATNSIRAARDTASSIYDHLEDL